MAGGMIGRAIAGVGAFCGLLGISLEAGAGFRYADDGTMLAFLIVCMALTSYVPADLPNRRLDRIAALAGAAAFGFFLVFPSTAAFDSLGYLDAGAWLSLCTILVPIGALYAWSKEGHGQATPVPAWDSSKLLSVLGIVLAVIGIWFEPSSSGFTYWNASSSGHALGLLMLIAAALNIAFLGGLFSQVRMAGSIGMLVAGASFGIFEFAFVGSMLNDFGSLGTGGWLEALGGLFLLVGVMRAHAAAHRPTASNAGVPATGAA